ncbi:unnamed protein product, partial [Rotaria socialis]
MRESLLILFVFGLIVRSTGGNGKFHSDIVQPDEILYLYLDRFSAQQILM